MDWWLMTSFVETEQLIPIAKAAEECGFAGVAFSDHLVYPGDLSSKYPYSDDGSASWAPETPWPDCWVTISALAAVTTRLKFTTVVFVAPLRDPFNLAKATSTASDISNGRLACGFGAGWMEEEFDLVGQQFKRRGARFDEMIDVMRLLWSGEMVGYHGEFYNFEEVQMSPPSKDHIPIWTGGLNKTALQRAARNDGWIGVHKTIEGTQDQINKLNIERQSLEAQAGGSLDKPFQIMTTSIRIPSEEDTQRLHEMGVQSIAIPALALNRSRELEARLDGIRAFAQKRGL